MSHPPCWHSVLKAQNFSECQQQHTRPRYKNKSVIPVPRSGLRSAQSEVALQQLQPAGRIALGWKGKDESTQLQAS